MEYDYWGNKSIIGNIKKVMFFDWYAAVPGQQLQGDIVAKEDCTILFLNIEKNSYGLSSQLSIPHHAYS